ncbi:MAG: pantoate--beta-alanine ligase [Bacteroidota bacterium]
MQVFNHINSIKTAIALLKANKNKIGFVPTMGALHKGHLSLLAKARSENDITVGSIFVNPVQFNQQEDFEKYPVQNDTDIALLKQAGCDMVFMPSVNEMYPEPPTEKFYFGQLETVMEGAFRLGHFNGVAIVVKKLFEIISPDSAYFGEKDFQQLQIVKQLVKQLELNIEIIACPIIREADGLAMSSRNVRLTDHQRQIAPQIYNLLKTFANQTERFSVGEIKSEFVKAMQAIPEFKLDYFEIVDEENLQPITHWAAAENPRAFVAVFMDNVRLIDNMKFFCSFAKS